MKSISPNLNIMIKTAEKASKVLIRDFGELENLQVSKKGPRDFVTNSDKKAEKIIRMCYWACLWIACKHFIR